MGVEGYLYLVDDKLENGVVEGLGKGIAIGQTSVATVGFEDCLLSLEHLLLEQDQLLQLRLLHPQHLPHSLQIATARQLAWLILISLVSIIFEVHVPYLQYCPHQLPDLSLLLLGKAYLLHGLIDLSEVFKIFDVSSSVGSALTQVVVLGRVFGPVFTGCSEGVEGMEGTLIGCDGDDSALL